MGLGFNGAFLGLKYDHGTWLRISSWGRDERRPVLLRKNQCPNVRERPISYVQMVNLINLHVCSGYNVLIPTKGKWNCVLAGEIHSLFDVLRVAGVTCTVILVKPHNRRSCWNGIACCVYCGVDSSNRCTNTHYSIIFRGLAWYLWARHGILS